MEQSIHTAAKKAIIFLSWFCLLTSPGFSQDTHPGVITAAEQHIVNGRYDSAIETLEGFLATNPRDRDALLMIARAHYWSGNIPAAGQYFERAFELFPGDLQTRIEFGRFLLETNRPERTEVVLTPVRSSGNAEVLALLGTAKYWSGDWTGAKQHFEQALMIDPKHEGAKTRLNEILAATATTFTLTPEYQTDNQPVNRLGSTVRFTVHVTPLSPFSFQAGYSTTTARDTVRTFPQASVSLIHVWPGSGFGFDISGGVTQASMRHSPDWSYNVGMFLRIRSGISLKGQYGHRPYFETESSLSTPVSITSWSILLDRPRSEDWIGQASFQSIRYFDGNTGTDLSGWILFPLGDQKPSSVKIGYGLAVQDTQEDRYELVSTMPITGSYVPYYTPLSLISHSALLSINLPVSNHLRLHINGSYGVTATEEAPVYSQQGPVVQGPPSPTGIVKKNEARSFHPWQARASLDLTLPSAPLHLAFEVSRFETAYYQISRALISATYTFPPALR